MPQRPDGRLELSDVFGGADSAGIRIDHLSKLGDIVLKESEQKNTQLDTVRISEKMTFNVLEFQASPHLRDQPTILLSASFLPLFLAEHSLRRAALTDHIGALGQMPWG